jgi:hypothetical protein
MREDVACEERVARPQVQDFDLGEDFGLNPPPEFPGIVAPSRAVAQLHNAKARCKEASDWAAREPFQKERIDRHAQQETQDICVEEEHGSPKGRHATRGGSLPFCDYLLHDRKKWIIAFQDAFVTLERMLGLTVAGHGN